MPRPSRSLIGGCAPAPAARRPLPPLRSFAPLFKALADETRLQLLALLVAAPGPLCACDLERGFALSQPTVSHHLKVLRQAGWVTASRRGSWMHYELSPPALARLDQFRGHLAPTASASASPARERALPPRRAGGVRVAR